jgi:hypothetical protein
MAVCPGPTATSFFEGVSTKMKADVFDSAELVVRRTLLSFDLKKSVAYPGRFSVRVAIWLPRLLPATSWLALPRRRPIRWVWRRKIYSFANQAPRSLGNPFQSLRLERVEKLDLILYR